MIEITVDSREHSSRIAHILQSMPETNVAVQELAIGDYVVSEGGVIERKEAGDFVASALPCDCEELGCNFDDSSQPPILLAHLQRDL